MSKEKSGQNYTPVYYLFFLLIGFTFIDSSISKRKYFHLNSQSFPNSIPLEPASYVKEVADVEVVREELIPENKEEYYGIYFLKFYNVNGNPRSKLVKVQRKLEGSLKRKIKLSLKELAKGPRAEEQEKGVLSTLPKKFSYDKKIKLIDGIFHISLNSNFEENANKQILQDRLDQLTNTIFEFKEVKGIKIYLNGEEIRSLGKDKLPLPEVLSRSSNRKIVFL